MTNRLENHSVNSSGKLAESAGTFPRVHAEGLNDQTSIADTDPAGGFW